MLAGLPRVAAISARRRGVRYATHEQPFATSRVCAGRASERARYLYSDKEPAVVDAVRRIIDSIFLDRFLTRRARELAHELVVLPRAMGTTRRVAAALAARGAGLWRRLLGRGVGLNERGDAATSVASSRQEPVSVKPEEHPRGRRRAALLSIATFVVVLVVASLVATLLLDEMGGIRAGLVAGLASGAATNVYFKSRAQRED